MKASALSFRAAVLFALIGMGMGIAMAIARDHSVMPAHAHLNLLGWVSLFLFGIYYRLNPALDVSRLARPSGRVVVRHGGAHGGGGGDPHGL